MSGAVSIPIAAEIAEELRGGIDFHGRVELRDDELWFTKVEPTDEDVARVADAIEASVDDGDGSWEHSARAAISAFLAVDSAAAPQ